MPNKQPPMSGTLLGLPRAPKAVLLQHTVVGDCNMVAIRKLSRTSNFVPMTSNVVWRAPNAQWILTLQYLKGVKNVLVQRFLRGEQMNNVQVHISRKWWAKLYESNVWSSPQSNVVPCSYPCGWIFVRSLLWIHGEAAVYVHYNCSCQCGSRELYKDKNVLQIFF
jgi:hypothetical protein